MIKKEILILAVLILLLFAINYQILDSLFRGFFNEKSEVVIERVIDGDTVVVKGNSVRLLGINAPEKGEEYYERAKDYLGERLLDKKVYFEEGQEKRDKYGRLLGYLYVDDKNVNLRLVERGFANFYFPSGKDKYYYQFKEAWTSCVEKDKNLCEKSEDKCSGCIIVSELDYGNDRVVFRNICNFNCNMTSWKVHDEGRKSFIFPKFFLGKEEYVEIMAGKGEEDKDTLFWKGEDYVWTKTGDTVFLRDAKGKLVLWYSY